MNKELPIIFSTEMVKAILSGRKTQTRRIIKQQKDFALNVKVGWIPKAFNDGSNQYAFWYDSKYTIPAFRCPFGKVGDKLWVRETWQTTKGLFGDDDDAFSYLYKADNPSGKYPNFTIEKWKPSIFMPKFASRITLEITDIRVERIQDISDKDVEAEGFTTSHYYCDEKVGHVCTSGRDLFINRWNWLNAKRGYSWENNRFVWVIEFKKLEK